MENGLVNLLNATQGSGYRHVIVCLDGYTEFRNRIRAADVEIVSLDKKPGKDLAHYFRMWRLFRQLRPEIVHTRNLGTVDAVFPAMLAGVGKRVHGEHGWDMVDLHGHNRKYRVLRRLCALLIDRHIAVSRHLAGWLHEVLGIPAARIVQIYNGVDTDKFSPPTAGRIDLVSDSSCELVIGTVGRMAEVKDQLSLVKAFVKLVREIPDARHRLRLVMVGDGPLREKIRDSLADSDVLDLVWMPGARDDISHVLKGMDLFVLPSLNEGISNTVLEAMATGLPVIATDVGGNPELVVPGRTGILVKTRDADALANAIRQYLDHPDMLATHGEAGRRTVEQDFSLQAMAGRYLDVYDSVLGISRPSPNLDC